VDRYPPAVTRSQKPKKLSQRLRTLKKQTGARTADEAIARKVSDVLRQLRILSPPVDVEQVAHACGFLRIEPKPLPLDALTFPTPNGSIIFVNSQNPHVRRRFSIAHEICHALIPGELKASEDAITLADTLEEHICDVGAANLLMPGPMLAAKCRGMRPSLKSLLDCSNYFEVSLEAFARRIADTRTWSRKWALVRWRTNSDGSRSGEWIAGTGYRTIFHTKESNTLNEHTGPTLRVPQLPEVGADPQHVYVQIGTYGLSALMETQNYGPPGEPYIVSYLEP